MKNWVYFIPSIYLNLFFMFFFSYFLVEAALFTFKIKSPTWQLLLRCTPFLKIPLDIFLYHFDKWSVLHNISLFSLPANAKILNAHLSFNQGIPSYHVGFYIENSSMRFAPFDLISEKIGFNWTFFIASLLFLYSIINVILFSIRIIREIAFSEEVIKEYPKNLVNRALLKDIKKKRLKIYIAKREGFSPYIQVATKRRIVLPRNILTILNPDQINTILAHEITHTHKIVFAISVLVLFLKSIFFFIPTYRVLQNIEKFCDFGIHKYDLDPLTLSEAIRILISKNPIRQNTMAHTFMNSYSTFDRVKTILLVKKSEPLFLRLIYFTIFFFLITFILLGQIGHF